MPGSGFPAGYTRSGFTPLLLYGGSLLDGWQCIYFFRAFQLKLLHLQLVTFARKSTSCPSNINVYIMDLPRA
jgi:hypothetical protein